MSSSRLREIAALATCVEVAGSARSPPYRKTGKEASEGLRLAEFGCKLASSIGEDPERQASQCHPDEFRDGGHGLVYPHSSRRSIVIKKMKSNSTSTLIVELHGLRKAEQLDECLYALKKDGSRQYYIYIRWIPEHRLTWALKADAFKNDITNPASSVFEFFERKIRGKAIDYAIESDIGHKDITSANIRMRGTTFEDLTVDFVDWSTWDEIDGVEELRTYLTTYLNLEVKTVLRTLESQTISKSPQK